MMKYVAAIMVVLFSFAACDTSTKINPAPESAGSAPASSSSGSSGASGSPPSSSGGSGGETST